MKKFTILIAIVISLFGFDSISNSNYPDFNKSN